MHKQQRWRENVFLIYILLGIRKTYYLLMPIPQYINNIYIAFIYTFI